MLQSIGNTNTHMRDRFDNLHLQVKKQMQEESEKLIRALKSDSSSLMKMEIEVTKIQNIDKRLS